MAGLVVLSSTQRLKLLHVSKRQRASGERERRAVLLGVGPAAGGRIEGALPRKLRLTPAPRVRSCRWASRKARPLRRPDAHQPVGGQRHQPGGARTATVDHSPAIAAHSRTFAITSSIGSHSAKASRVPDPLEIRGPDIVGLSRAIVGLGAAAGPSMSTKLLTIGPSGVGFNCLLSVSVQRTFALRI